MNVLRHRLTQASRSRALVAALCGCLAVVSALSSTSCAGMKVYAQTEVVRLDIKKAKESGAYTCAPVELALAESNIDFADNELSQGDLLRAQQHIELAVQNANAALANSRECAPKRVLIKQKTDLDGDGVMDDVDGPAGSCKDQPEDVDLFEDEDGCPDVDNDNDNVLDTVDRCKNTPGPADNDGCPYGDSDKDGVPDKDDLCPTVPEDKDGDRDDDGRPDVDVDGDGVEDCVEGCALVAPPPAADGTQAPAPMCDLCTRGTPEQTLEDKDDWKDDDGCPEVDNDQDGILDKVDVCPNEAGPLELRGCPDADADQIPDLDDKCPKVPGVDQRATNPAQHGCPRADTDGDSFFDDEDKCPTDKGVDQKAAHPDRHGCPLLDADGDGFTDDVDACPQQAGVSWADNGEWKNKNPKGGDGCPPPLTLVIIKADKIEIKQQVQFETGKATILPVSAKLLAEVGLVIRTSPMIKKVTVEGHTDDVGDDDYNLQLSQARANSVRQWLVDKEKVDPSLLVAQGFGETQPIASNRTKAGRQSNRRVEFKVER